MYSTGFTNTYYNPNPAHLNNAMMHHVFFLKFVNIPGLLLHCFPVFSTLCIFHRLHFLHSAFPTLCIIHTPHFPHSTFSTLRTLYNPSNLPFSFNLKRERFFAHVYFSNETVSQTTVSTGPMKMFRLEHETVIFAKEM